MASNQDYKLTKPSALVRIIQNISSITSFWSGDAREAKERLKSVRDQLERGFENVRGAESTEEKWLAVCVSQPVGALASDRINLSVTSHPSLVAALTVVDRASTNNYPLDRNLCGPIAAFVLPSEGEPTPEMILSCFDSCLELIVDDFTGMQIDPVLKEILTALRNLEDSSPSSENRAVALGVRRGVVNPLEFAERKFFLTDSAAHSYVERLRQQGYVAASFTLFGTSSTHKHGQT